MDTKKKKKRDYPSRRSGAPLNGPPATSKPVVEMSAKGTDEPVVRNLPEVYTYRAVKKFPEFPCRRRTSEKIAHTLLWWGAQHVCSQAQQVWTGFSVQCRYCSV
jgi:hypothetical protein